MPGEYQYTAEDLDDIEKELRTEGRECEACGGLLGHMGVLGKLLWLVCRNCGLQFSVPINRERR